ncbi:MAG: ferric reductase-like transmembrane domain-containing protein [Actinophytocola sp.]|uniref:ferric reductase-like transmembrane domain-containing protein n=1 Tax=Actinophytocola sp. TaxID=1872138 RepID=UPI003C790E4F
MLVLAAASHDDGVRELSVLSARLAYALMCLSLTWGVVVSTGWFDRLTGQHALRGTHQLFATLTLAFAFVHGVSFLLLTTPTPAADLIIPFRGVLRDTFGILAFEGMLTAAIAVGLKRWTSYWRWLWLHRLAYPAFALGVLHAFFQALAKGTLSSVYLGGLTLLVPAVTVILLRLVPAKTLEAAGLAEDGP